MFPQSIDSRQHNPCSRTTSVRRSMTSKRCLWFHCLLVQNHSRPASIVVIPLSSRWEWDQFIEKKSPRFASISLFFSASNCVEPSIAISRLRTYRLFCVSAYRGVLAGRWNVWDASFDARVYRRTCYLTGHSSLVHCNFLRSSNHRTYFIAT